MGKLIKFTGIIIFLLNNATAFAIDANYTNLFEKHGSSFGIGADSVRLNDLIFSATHCAASDEYACVISKTYVFSVLKHEKNRTSWFHSGASYHVLSNQERLIRGEIIKYRVIRQVWKKNIFEYVYSDDYGVLAIKGRDGHELMLLEKCGFAAISEKYGCK